MRVIRIPCFGSQQRHTIYPSRDPSALFFYGQRCRQDRDQAVRELGAESIQVGFSTYKSWDGPEHA